MDEETHADDAVSPPPAPVPGPPAAFPRPVPGPVPGPVSGPVPGAVPRPSGVFSRPPVPGPPVSAPRPPVPGPPAGPGDGTADPVGDGLPEVARLAATVAGLDDLGELPVGEHVARYDAVHGELQDALASIDGV
jgi:hypothetical protein